MIGATISHYKITEKLGEGGMGVVYKAEDTKLDRPVALKFLAPHLLRDEEGRKRFEREAKSAARLDHPNICTVHEIDEVDGRTFIVMAFLEGRPLSERIKEGPLKLPEALSVAIQMAEGLEAAHAKGITHRDIKPDNVMLMSDSRGLVKLMDFGLAQLAGSSKFTREGTTLGTVNYMSPEQGEGAETDPRTDIWSLGVVLYEMVAGQKPFRGDYDQAVIFSIMNEPPEPLTGVRTGVPKKLERIVNKCLAKNADERYQHVSDLLVDLQACRRELEEPQPSRVVPPVAQASGVSPLLVGAGVAVLVAVLAVGWWFGRSTDSGEEGPPEYQSVRVTQDTGYTGDPALSPDGKFLAYASDRAGQGDRDIWVQPLGGGDLIPLTTDEADDREPAFSLDGNRIVFRSSRDGGGIYVIPALGGTERRIADAGRNPAFSPDGMTVSYGRPEFNTENERFVGAWVVSASGGVPRQVKTNLAVASPEEWSPDGKYLLVVGSVEPGSFGRASELDWWLVPHEGGKAIALGMRERLEALGVQLLDRRRRFPRPSAWVEDGSWVVFDAQTSGGTRNLWRVRVSASEQRLLGEPQKLTSGIGEESATVSLDGRIAFMYASENYDIWRLPLDANRAVVTGGPERIVSGLSTDFYPSVSSDGQKLVYTSGRAGNLDIWLRDLTVKNDTGTPITVAPTSELRGVISPDGTKVVFRRTEDGKTNVYLIKLGRGSEEVLLRDVGSHMDFTLDGKKILFYTNAPIRWRTLDLETLEQHDLGLEHSEDPVHSVRFSPDQHWVSFKLQNPESPIFIARMVEQVATDQNQWIKVADASTGAAGHNWWSPDGNTIYFLSRRDEFQCIWAQSLDPTTKEPRGELKPVLHLHDRLRYPAAGAPFAYGLRGDEHYLPLAETNANIWMAEPVEQR